tara:strand:+ start:167 stop:1324 length:1158 start_codon:yes stop_codon:yes gene_type:complete
MKPENKKFIPLSVPNLSGNELKYVKECLSSGWISSVGKYVNEFENSVASYVKSKYGVAVVNGTSALHIALKIIGVKSNDYVIMPNITFVATANSIKYLGADPILIDADINTWQMDLELLNEFLEKETYLNDNGNLILSKDKRIIRAIVPVHVQGNIGDMDKLLSISKKYNLKIIEDAAESLGSTYKGKHSGTFGLLGCFSFNGNKIISSGGGGVIVSNDKNLADKAKHLTTTAKTDSLHYYHDMVGYNYRLVNVLAAIGLAQMEQLDVFLKKKKSIYDYYKNNLKNISDISFQKVLKDVDHNNWLITIKTKQQKKLLDYLNFNNILSRPFWCPMNKLPMYKDLIYISKNDNCKKIHETCLSIPCSTNIKEEDLSIVVNFIKKFFK